MRNTNERLNMTWINRDETNLIKGVAIVLMVIHHVFTFPNLWIESVAKIYERVNYSTFCNSFIICVPIFAFLTGYFYFFTKRKNYKYSIKKITDLWIAYLFVFLCFVVVGCILGVYEFSFIRFITDGLALTGHTMIHGWYVIFYSGTMVLLPIFHKISEKSGFFAFSLFVLLPLLSRCIFELSPFSKSLPFLGDYINFFIYLPVVASGYLFSKYGIFENSYKHFKRLNIFFRITVSLFLMVITFLLRSKFDSYDFISTPLFVFGFVSIVKEIKYTLIWFPLSLLGKNSLLIWFLHCAYANQLKYYTQPVLYFPKNPILVTIWGLLMCLVVAIIIKTPIDYLIKIKNRQKLF